ncbi:heparan sulfate glucosamine 3-O-sulfotransferase 5-like [Diadema antillarum]|uniref:heparan sulfate glucosamine 3-O-sulfotransferase 5-like n=1 Tax=Diadema antillarum TaxID=105358 RepID=UPI003A881A39
MAGSLGAILGVTVTFCFVYPLLDPRFIFPVTTSLPPRKVNVIQSESTANQRTLSAPFHDARAQGMNESALPVENVSCPEDGRPSSRVEALDCRRRLPTVIGIGAMKCGAAALSFFLEAHPYIVHSHPIEVRFWNKHFLRGMEWYREQMPISSKYQVTMEKTPEYIRYSNISGMMKKLMPPTTKFILVVRDPFTRAVSNYVHHLTISGMDKMSRSTFESSVLSEHGGIVQTSNWAIRGGMYSIFFRKWLADFPLERFIVIDGDQFQTNPVPILQEVEAFLGIPRFFDESSVFFDHEKGFYCRTHEDPAKRCLGHDKGRPHPIIDRQVEERVRAFFRPYNADFESMVGKKFNWK